MTTDETSSNQHAFHRPSQTCGGLLCGAALLLCATVSVPAAAAGHGRWSTLASFDPEVASRVAAAYAAATPAERRVESRAAAGPCAGCIGRRAIVGTWRIAVEIPDVPEPIFRALHTYGEDGTFSETTDLLNQLVEGIGHGTWTYSQGVFLLTFELYDWDDATKEPTGMVRVRNAIELQDRNHLFAGESVVDLLDADGNLLAEAVATATLRGTRVTVLAP
jgi:hypothetical protein